MEKKFNPENLRRMALAMQNAAEWQGKFFAELIEQLDSGKLEDNKVEAAPAKGKGKKSAPVQEEVEAEEMEEVESKFAKGKGKKSAPVQEEVEAEEDDFMNDDAEEEVNEPTLDEVRKVVKDFATKHGKEKALKLLGKFKVTSIPDIKKSDYAKVIELAKKHL